MSAPPLPEAFGNYALGDFVEAVSPEDISWLPQTIGWQILGLALLLLGLYRGWQGLRRWYRNRYRREATAKLKAWQQQPDGALLAEDVNRLLKLTALAAFPREQVAGLYGRDWVEFLNAQCPGAPFASAGRAPGWVYRATPGRTGGNWWASLSWVREHGSPLDD